MPSWPRASALNRSRRGTGPISTRNSTDLGEGSGAPPLPGLARLGPRPVPLPPDSARPFATWALVAGSIAWQVLTSPNQFHTAPFLTASCPIRVSPARRPRTRPGSTRPPRGGMRRLPRLRPATANRSLLGGGARSSWSRWWWCSYWPSSPVPEPSCCCAIGPAAMTMTPPAPTVLPVPTAQTQRPRAAAGRAPGSTGSRRRGLWTPRPPPARKGICPLKSRGTSSSAR
ncbi:MAG: hypothetical protein DI576_04900 [Actinomyces sp.]|nr:MAG: hypothetical protein DI576_04900 [Actinomyces sp.]